MVGPSNRFLGIHAITVYVRDQDESLRFYLDQLGFDLAFDAQLPSGDRWVAVAPPDGTAVRDYVHVVDIADAHVRALEIPLDWLPPDIVLTNNSGPHGPKCEDFCTMALLSLSQRLPRLMHQQREKRWHSIFTVPIAGKVCVVIGYGDIGQAAVRAAKKLSLTAIACTPPLPTCAPSRFMSSPASRLFRASATCPATARPSERAWSVRSSCSV